MAKTVKVYSLKSEGSKSVSKNFKVREFACKDGSDAVFISPELVNVLQKIRTYFGKPITINSAYRTPTHNKSVGGVATSQHCYGTAADIVVSGVSPAKVAAYARKIMPTYGGVGTYDGFTHIDVRTDVANWRG